VNSDLEIGDKVTLSVESEFAGYGPAGNNPTDCEGTIYGCNIYGWCQVKWDNGHTNTYPGNGSDLIKIKE